MSWTDFWNSYIDLAPGIGQVCLRLLCAMVVGLVIGTEREYTNRPAGMRTHILVALGACTVAITGEMIFHHYSAMGATPDPARLSAQVITGVGFLGAGTILREGSHVKGLTTAASLWAVACLGIAAGSGYYAVALAGMVFIFITLTILENLQDSLVKGHSGYGKFRMVVVDVAQGLSLLNTHAEAQRAQLQEILANKQEDGSYEITFCASFAGFYRKKRSRRFFEHLAGEAAVRSLSRIEDTAGSKV